jgi:hypothetical protein
MINYLRLFQQLAFLDYYAHTNQIITLFWIFDQKNNIFLT